MLLHPFFAMLFFTIQMDYYMYHPESPTRITKPICRPGTSMEAWLAAHKNDGGDAPKSIPSATESSAGQLQLFRLSVFRLVNGGAVLCFDFSLS